MIPLRRASVVAFLGSTLALLWAVPLGALGQEGLEESEAVDVIVSLQEELPAVDGLAEVYFTYYPVGSRLEKFGRRHLSVSELASGVRLSGRPNSIQVVGVDLWSPIVHLPRSDERIRLVISATRTERRRGRVHFPRGDLKRPDYLTASLAPTHPRTSDNRWTPEETFCPLGAQGDFSCFFPVARAAARFRAGGFASVTVDLQGPEANDVVLDLVPEGTVRGEVRLRGATRPDLVRVQAIRMRRAHPDESPGKALLESIYGESALDDRGSFALKNLPAGTYDVLASGPDGTARSSPVTIGEGQSVALPEPLSLGAPLGIEIVVDPPLTPWRAPWYLRLLHRPVGAMAEKVERRLAVPPSGSAELTSLQPGDYVVRLEDEKGSLWAEEVIQLRDSSMSVALRADLVHVRGRFLSDGEGTEALLRLSSRKERHFAILEADRHGEIDGYVVAEGKWEVRVLEPGQLGWTELDPVTIEVGPNGAATIVVTRPDTHLSGVVLDETGAGVADAEVICLLKKSEGAAQRSAVIRTESDGTFTRAGLRLGTTEIMARAREGSSDWQTIELEEGGDVRVLLELGEGTEVVGTVSCGRSAQPGGNVTFLTSLASPARVREGKSTPVVGGRFATRLRRGSYVAVLDSAECGFALRELRVDQREMRPLTLAIAETGTLEIGGLDALAGKPLFLRNAAAMAPLEALLRSSATVWDDALRVAVARSIESGDWGLCTDSLGGNCRVGWLPPDSVLSLSAGD